MLVLTLLCHGCPVQAIVAAFGLDERTVARWFSEAGRHCQRVHEHLVEQGQVDLQHVQADELWVKQVGGKVWMALALAVPSRLWLGGVISRHRDLDLITRLVQRVLACAVTRAILVCVDGLASYVTAFPKVFRQPIRTGRRGRPRLVLPDGFQLAQVVKHSAKRHVIGVTRRVVHGTLAGIEAVLTATATGTVINTAYIERLNATFRGRLVTLVRRVIAYQQQIATHPIHVDAVVPELVCLVDVERMERVIGNLVSNAIKYSAEGEDVTVRLTREQGAMEEWAILEVQDRGMGIPTDDLPQVFERFYRAENVGETKGTGIGLASVREIVEQHGGSIAVASRTL